MLSEIDTDLSFPSIDSQVSAEKAQERFYAWQTIGRVLAASSEIRLPYIHA